MKPGQEAKLIAGFGSPSSSFKCVYYAGAKPKQGYFVYTPKVLDSSSLL